MLLDSDDSIEKDSCEKLFERAEKEDLDIVICDFYKEYEDGRLEEIHTPNFSNSSLKANPDIITEYLGKRNYAVYYGLIPQIDYRYDKPSEYFWEFVNIMGDIRDDINKAIEMAEKVKDYSASDVLASFLSEHIDLYTKQAFILYYQSLQEEEHGNLSSFNSHFEDLMIITE